MRSQSPLEACIQIAGEHAANRIAAVVEERAARLATRLENYGKALSELGAELAGDRVSDGEEDASE